MHLVTRNGDPESREYGLKVLKNSGASQARQRFYREIQAVKSLNHPSIVRVVDHSEEDQPFQFYVMEYHKGARDLDRIIFSQENPYHGNVEESLGLFEQIISAVGICENSNPQIVHRDIKPKNVLVLPDGSACLIDFGICQIQDGTTITLTDENVGSRNYTSPECEFGEGASVGIRSDIYSAAKVLWSAITSKGAFAREEPVFGNQSMENIFPTQKDTWHLMNIFEKTIRRRPEDRCKTTTEVLAEIQEVKYLIRGAFPPLKDVGRRCPSCGSNNIKDFQQGYRVFGNPNPHGIVSLVCGRCGFGFVRDTQIWDSNVRRHEGLS